MQRLLFLGVVAVLTATFAVPATADTKRHLVYNFTIGVNSDQHDKDSSVKFANGPGGKMIDLYGTGDTSYKGTLSDSGQVIVDYQGVESDGGLVVNVSEEARTNRTSVPTACVIYSNTNVVCGGSNVNPEEITVLRTLSPRFFDPTLLDANRHWQIPISASGAGGAIDFTASPQGVGVMTIDSQRNLKTTAGDTTSATAKYTYEYQRLLPTTLKEYTTERHEIGVGQYVNITIDVTATLVTDSLAAKS